MSEDDGELKAIRERKARRMLQELERERERENWPSEPVELTDANFRDVVSRYPLVVVDMWAEWCSPCRMIAPIIERLAAKYAGKVVFGKLNVDENPKTANAFKVMSIPTLLIIKERELADRIIGAVPQQHIESVLNRYI